MVEVGGVAAALGVPLGVPRSGFLHLRAHGLQVITGRDDGEKEQHNARHQQQAAA
jgi:hypothetical protein